MKKDDMANTYTQLIYHAVFSVVERKKLLSKEVRNRLFPYIAAIGINNDFTILTSGGYDDHVHVLLSLKPSIQVSKALQLIKGGSSKWMHDTFPSLKTFSWQHGYGAFSVSYSQIDMVKRYIASQEEHHKKITFEDEYIALLEKNHIVYDNAYVF